MHAIKKGPVPIPEKQSTHIPIFNQLVVVVLVVGVGVGGWRLVLVVCCLLLQFRWPLRSFIEGKFHFDISSQSHMNMKKSAVH